MKYLFLSLVFTASAVGHAIDINTLSKEIKNEMSSESLAPSKPYEDIKFPTTTASSGKNKENIQEYKELIEELANNEIRYQDNIFFTQAEANVLVKYFVQLNLNADELLSLRFQASLKLNSYVKKVQAMQIVSNIAKTKIDMDSFIEQENGTCFFRNYKEVASDVGNADFVNHEAKIVGKCRPLVY